MLSNRKAEALMAVIETGSFELAAARLNLTTSAISQRVKSLETYLGVPLIVRARPCRSTREGLKLVQYLRRAKMLSEEFEADYFKNSDFSAQISIAVNNDSLGTWLLFALSNFIAKEDVLITLIVDDQDFTHTYLEDGRAIAAVSSKDIAMRGCDALRLGAMRYRLLCSVQFFKTWFDAGVFRERLCKAPLLVFDQKDTLQSDFLNAHFKVRQESCRCHTIPSTDAFFKAITLGIGYGMVAELDYKGALSNGELIDLSPGNHSDISLFWHCWRAQSPKVEELTRCLIKETKALLR
jgi:LysR family transcriptional regulator (chromosome initiation inhibitor)